MLSLLTWPLRAISKTATGWRPGWARPSQRSVILRCTGDRYQANGKSVTSSVIAPWPCAEPDGRPSAGAGGSARDSARAVVVGAGVGRGVVGLDSDGSSFSPARGVATGRGGSARSGRLRSGRLRSGRLGARSGSAGGGVGAAFGVSRAGNSCGRCATRGGGSSGRGGSVGVGAGLPCGVPTAATAGTRFTTYVFGWLFDNVVAATNKITPMAAWVSADSTVAVTGSGALRRTGPAERGRR